MDANYLFRSVPFGHLPGWPGGLRLGFARGYAYAYAALLFMVSAFCGNLLAKCLAMMAIQYAGCIQVQLDVANSTS